MQHADTKYSPSCAAYDLLCMGADRLLSRALVGYHGMQHMAGMHVLVGYKQGLTSSVRPSPAPPGRCRACHGSCTPSCSLLPASEIGPQSAGRCLLLCTPCLPSPRWLLRCTRRSVQKSSVGYLPISDARHEGIVQNVLVVHQRHRINTVNIWYFIVGYMLRNSAQHSFNRGSLECHLLNYVLSHRHGGCRL